MCTLRCSLKKRNMSPGLMLHSHTAKYSVMTACADGRIRRRNALIGLDDQWRMREGTLGP